MPTQRPTRASKFGKATMRTWGVPPSSRRGRRQSAPTSSPRRRAQTQAGGTLIEVLVSIAILSILLLGVMAGITTALRSSSSNHEVAVVRSLLSQVADNAATITFPACGSEASLGPQIATATGIPAGYSVSVSGIRDLLPAASGCVSAANATVRLLKVTVRADDGSASVTGDVVVRNLTARPT